MRRENVETATVQLWFAAFPVDADAFRETLHPDVEWFPFEDNHSPSHGVDGAMRVRSHWLESWEDQDIELEDFTAQDGNVVVTCHVTARGRGSGVEVDTRLHFHFRLRDDKIVHIYEHLDRAEALEAAGITA
jgi:ketosteroid isomerase-like protein